MGDEKVRKGRSSKEPKVEEPRLNLRYNELREGIIREIEAKFSTPEISKYEANEEISATKYLKEFEEDTTVPEDLDMLYNFNASLNICETKWLRRHDTFSKSLTKNKAKREALTALIIQEYKRNPDAHNGLLLSDKEIANLVILNPDRIELEMKIANIEAIISIIEKALSRIDGMSFRIKNALNTLAIKHRMQFN